MDKRTKKIVGKVTKSRAKSAKGLLLAFAKASVIKKREIARQIMSRRDDYFLLIGERPNEKFEKKVARCRKKFGLFPPAVVARTRAGAAVVAQQKGAVSERLELIKAACYRKYFAACGWCLPAVQDEMFLGLSVNDEYPYRKSSSTWAGGEHSTRITITLNPDEIECEGSSEKVWSKNGNWTGTNSSAEFTIHERVLVHFSSPLYQNLIHLDAERVGNREYRAIWAEQSRGFDLKKVSGWIIRGHHVRGGSLENARRKAAKARKKAVEAATLQRKKRHENAEFVNTCKEVFVGFDDSINAGNCKPATETMRARVCKELGGQVGAVRADVLLEMRDDMYVRRAIAVAAERR